MHTDLLLRVGELGLLVHTLILSSSVAPENKQNFSCEGGFWRNRVK